MARRWPYPLCHELLDEFCTEHFDAYLAVNPWKPDNNPFPDAPDAFPSASTDAPAHEVALLQPPPLNPDIDPSPPERAPDTDSATGLPLAEQSGQEVLRGEREQPLAPPPLAAQPEQTPERRQAVTARLLRGVQNLTAITMLSEPMQDSSEVSFDDEMELGESASVEES